MLRVDLPTLKGGRGERKRCARQFLQSGQGNDMSKKEVVTGGLVCQGKSCVISVVREALFVPVISLLSECEDATLFQTLCNVSPVSCRAAQCGVGWPGSEIVTSSPGKWAAEATGAVLAAMQWRTADGCGSSSTGTDIVICWLALMAAQATFGSRAGLLTDSHRSPGRQWVRRWGTSERVVMGLCGHGVCGRRWAPPESAVMSPYVRGICGWRCAPPGRAVLSPYGSGICGCRVRRAGSASRGSVIILQLYCHSAFFRCNCAFCSSHYSCCMDLPA